MSMNNESLATEILHELKATSRRWFIAFITVLLLWFATIAGFLWYISLPVEELSDVEIENTSGNASYIGRDLNGVLDYGIGEGEDSQTSGPEK